MKDTKYVPGTKNLRVGYRTIQDKNIEAIHAGISNFKNWYVLQNN